MKLQKLNTLKKRALEKSELASLYGGKPIKTEGGFVTRPDGSSYKYCSDTSDGTTLVRAADPGSSIPEG